MNKIYILYAGYNDCECYSSLVTGVFTDPELADENKRLFEAKVKEMLSEPSPIEWYEEDNYEGENWVGNESKFKEVTPELKLKYYDWKIKREKAEEFNKCWVEEVELNSLNLNFLYREDEFKML